MKISPTNAERDWFAAYLEENANAGDGMADQMEANQTHDQEIVDRARRLAAAQRIVACNLRNSRTLGE